MSGMVCQQCGENPATIHLTEIKSEGGRVQLDFCESCATAQGMTNEVALPSMLAGMVAASTRSERAESLRCPHCNITFKEFRRKGRLGCPMDYDVFEEPLKVMLRNWHNGATRHEGRLPRGRTEVETTVSERLLQLRRELQTAIGAEDYETAASIRDEIHAIERGTHRHEFGEESVGGSPWDPASP